jgi:hypothetical protein
MNTKKIALISLLLLLVSAVCPAQTKPGTKISDTPLPCNLSLAESPALVGVKLDMPLADAAKLFSRGLVNSSIKVAGPGDFANSSFHVSSIGLPKVISGIPVRDLTFSGPAKGNVDWVTIRFADKQTLTPEQLLERVAGFTRVAREMWQLVDDGDSPLVSWHAECRGFQIQFETQKGNFYKLWLAPNDDVPLPTDKPAERE